jgi:cytoskeletal protein RodZ
MKSVGVLLKAARKKKRMKISDVAYQTKIKEKFLVALEKEDWQHLPNFSVARGFTTAFAKVVGVDPSYAVALLRRDFPQARYEQEKIKNVDFEPKIMLGPRGVLSLIVFLGAILAGVYLVRQYIFYSAAPPLDVRVIKEGEKVIILGKTFSSATVEVEQEPVVVDEKGEFKFEIDKDKVGGRVIEIKATSRTGKETLIRKTID